MEDDILVRKKNSEFITVEYKEIDPPEVSVGEGPCTSAGDVTVRGETSRLEEWGEGGCQVPQLPHK